MKKTTLFLLSISTLFFLPSCKKEKVIITNYDYLIFGHFYGICQGEKCIEIYKLEPNKVSEDTIDAYPSSNSFYNGSYVELSSQKFMAVQNIADYFPADLLSDTNKVIGLPDAGDWGGLYIEFSKNGIRKFWLLDQMKSNVPTKYHAFIDTVNEKIKLLQ